MYEIETKSLSKHLRKSAVAKRVVYWTVAVLTALTALYLLSALVTGSAWLPLGRGEEAPHLAFLLAEYILCLPLLYLPTLAGKLSHTKIPDALCAAFYIFVFCATVLGDAFSFFYKFAFWDVMLHFGSGVMLAMFGSILVVNYLEKKEYENIISPAFIAVAALCFALAIGAIWEIYEFMCDSLFALNMQKYLLEDGTALIGHAAVVDTMKDLIMDLFGGELGALLVVRSRKQKSA